MINKFILSARDTDSMYVVFSGNGISSISVAIRDAKWLFINGIDNKNTTNNTIIATTIVPKFFFTLTSYCLPGVQDFGHISVVFSISGNTSYTCFGILTIPTLLPISCNIPTMYALSASIPEILLAIFLAAIPTFKECFVHGPGFNFPATSNSFFCFFYCW